MLDAAPDARREEAWHGAGGWLWRLRGRASVTGGVILCGWAMRTDGKGIRVVALDAAGWPSVGRQSPLRRRRRGKMCGVVVFVAAWPGTEARGRRVVWREGWLRDDGGRGRGEHRCEGACRETRGKSGHSLEQIANRQINRI